jgi:hypothetical protein
MKLLRTILATVLGACGAVAVAAPAAHASGTTYYVDSAGGSDANSGTSASSPWQSLAKVDATAFQPGDTIAFKGGDTWSGAGLTITSSGSASAPITVTSYGTGRALLAGNDAVQATVTLSNVHDVQVSNLEVTNSVNLAVSNSTDYRGIYVVAKDTGNMPGIVIANNYVHAIDGKGTSRIGEGGIVVGVRGNTTATWFSNLRITGNEVANSNTYGISTFTTWCASCDIYTAETGIPTSEVSATRQAFTGSVFQDNYVHDVAGGGITPQYIDNGLVQGNTVDKAASHRLVFGGGNVGIWWQGTNNLLVQYNTVRRTAVDDFGNPDPVDDMGFDADMGSQNSVVQYNYSDSNNGGFFMCLITSDNNIVRYNVSQNDGYREFSVWSGCSNLRVYNNTVWGTSATETRHNSDGSTFQQGVEAFVRDQDQYNNEMFDNVFYNPQHATYAYSGDNSMDYSHNLYWDGSAASTVTPANDPSAIVADPEFVNPGAAVPPTGVVTTAQLRQILAGYATQSSSPARDAGVSTSTAPKTDLFGTAIPAGAVDLGASQHAVSVTASTSFATGQGTIANLADGDPGTSWASTASPAFPGTVALNYSQARTIDGVTLAAAFGQGQAPTSVDVQTWNGSAWVTQVSGATLTWKQNTASPEYLRIALPSAVTTTGVQLVVKAANHTWGDVALNEVIPTFGASASSGLGVRSGLSSAWLVGGTMQQTWASANSPTLPNAVEIDPGATQTVSSVTLSAWYGQGQGPTSVSVEANPGGVWQQVLAPTAITWSSNTGTVENRTLTLPSAITATQFRIVIRAANLSWGAVALNKVALNS